MSISSIQAIISFKKSCACIVFLFLSFLGTAQHMPADSLVGSIKSIKDSIAYVSKASLQSKNLLHKNSAQHQFSYAATDSLFLANWLQTATSTFRRTIQTFNRDRDILHREWYDHVLDYKFKEDFVYYNKGQIQFYEVKNIPLRYNPFPVLDDYASSEYSHQQEKSVDSLVNKPYTWKADPIFRYSKDYDRKAYFEYNKNGDVTFEMNEDAYFQIRKFYYDYDQQGRLILIKHFKDGTWRWTENVEYPDQIATQIFLFPSDKRFPYLVEQRLEYIKQRFTEIERIEIPEDDRPVTAKQKRVITYDDELRIKSNDYWKEVAIAPGRYEYRNLASDHMRFETNETVREIYIKGNKTLTETYTTNAQNQPIKFTAFNHPMDKMLETYTFSYNNARKLHEVAVYNYDVPSRTTIAATLRFDYRYDAMGNWIQQVKYVNGVPIFIWDRVIDYY